MEGLSPEARDYTEEIALFQRVARIFGYEGLDIEVRPGQGWGTMRNEHGITLIADPTMLTPPTLEDATGAALPGDVEPPEQYGVYGTAHELGHVDDFMHPKNDAKEVKNMRPSEHFFWNIVDDSVINKRLRNIPLLNTLTDEVYRDMLFPVDDFTDKPKHVQLMYGWLLRNVTPQRDITLNGEVVDALDSLSSVTVGRRHYDLYRTLAHPNTDFEKRREIARTHILPIYEAFLEEDRQEWQQNQQNQQGQQSGQGSSSGESDESNGSGSGQGGTSESGDQSGSGGGYSGTEDWEEVYDAYAEASHCGHHEEEGGDDANDNSQGQDPHAAIEEAAGALREIAEEEAEAAEQAASNGSGNQGGQGGTGAGSIAAELQLSPDDAFAYQSAATKYRDQIHGVARVFEQLAVPSVEYNSPRYRKRADTSGLKLSPRDLFQVVVAQHSNIDPAVWKPVESITRKEGYTFSGLDIHLVVDGSGSMGGAKAEAAAACGVMLMEGLESARRRVQRHNPRAPKPDVRLQTIVFGASAQVVAPLQHEIAPQAKGITFMTVRAAASGSTIVTGALQMTIDSARANPERTQLVYLVTDGVFDDNARAANAVKNAGSNYFLYEYILMSPGTRPITPQSSYLSDPNEMPSLMNRHLRQLSNKFLS